MSKTQSILADGSDFEFSLTKMSGLKIKDIFGYVSREFDDPVFNITKIVMGDGSKISVEGEHDIAYIPSNDRVPYLSEEYFNEIDPIEEDED